MKNITNLFERGIPKRIVATILTVCMVFTMSPPFTAAQASVTDSGKRDTLLLSGFAALAGEVREQSVPIGTSSVELILPDTLEATVHSVSEDTELVPPAEPSEPTKPQPTEPEEPVPPTVPPTVGESEPTPENSQPIAPQEPLDSGTMEKPAGEAEPAPDEPTATEDTPSADEPATQVLSAYVESDITEADEDTITPAAITVEGVTWTSQPEYDGDIAGTYKFTAVLPVGYTVEESVAMPEITVTVGHILEYGDCMDFDCPTHYPPEVLAMMNENEDPVPLTLTDLVEDFGVETPPARRTRAAPTPQTLVVTDDNENNAHTGTADRDMDVFMNFKNMGAPIEVRFDLNNLPTQNAFIAIKAMDVDEEDGEDDHVWVNGKEIGLLSGTSKTWNTTVLEIPIDLLKIGSNYVEVHISEDTVFGLASWVVSVDWMQLILDGGKKDTNIDSFSLKLGDPVNTNKTVQVPATVTINQKGSTEYVTEYSLIQIDTGNALDAKFGKAQTRETVSLSMPLNAQTGTYKIIGILKDPVTEVIQARDEAAFIFTQDVGAIVGPKMTHRLTPSGLTNQSVAIAVSVADAYDCTNITIQDGGTKTVTANGDYAFTVSYKYDGGDKSFVYTVPVTNIDKTPPTITYTPLTVAEETSNAEIDAMFKAALSVTDDRQLASDMPTYTLPANIAATYGTRNVTVTATDVVGNTATKECAITVTPLPLKLVQKEPVRVGTTYSFTLSAELKNTGGNPITETGFVWGIMQSPTTAVNNGTTKTASLVTTKGGTITVTATDIVDGIIYYARPYAIAGGKTYYSDQKAFSYGGKQYGSFTVTNNNNSTFTITRTGGSEGAQIVYYRTVNGSAVGGTHFTHAANTVTFAAGETSKIITVTEQGVNAAHSGKPATAFSNANRTYQLEIYWVEGGGTITGGVSRATRTMTGNTEVDKSLYSNEKTVKRPDPTDPAWWVHDHGGGSAGDLYFVHDRSGAQADHINWNTSASISDGRYTADETTYLKGTSPNYLYRYWLNANEIKDGWEHAWIGNHVPNNVATQTKASKSYTSNAIALDDNVIGPGIWSGVFQVKEGSGITFSLPQMNTGGAESTGTTFSYNGDTIKAGTKNYAKMGINDTAYSYFAATGNTANNWQVRGFTDYILPYDTKEPQLVGVAPMAGGSYKWGDTFTVALVFDEIVDGTNSTLSNVWLNTNFGTMQYAGGADTNVLYFMGTVPQTALDGEITINSIEGAVCIKDMCDQTGTDSGGSGSGSITVDYSQPTITITDTDIVNGTAKGTITATSHSSLKYTWTQTDSLPVSGWIPCTTGTIAQTRQTSGIWYLYALAERSSNGTSNYTKYAFNFSNTVSPLPALTVSADNTNWARRRDISVVHTPVAATVTYDGPQSGSTSDDTVVVTQNGLYTFTLTSGDETISEMVSVSKVDAVAPTLTLREPGGTGAVYNTLTFGANASDNLSGVAKVEYAVNDTTTIPYSGWVTLTGSGGSYTGSYTETSATKTIKYIHVRATDVAGNVTTKTSAAYTVVKAGAAAAPTITLTGAPSDWVKGPVSLSWTVTNAGAGGATVNLNGSTSAATNGTLAATGNGLYSVTVTDQNGVSASASLLVDKIDAEAPILTGLTASKDWSSTVTLAGVTDNRTPLPDANGTTTGYGGSGLKTQEWKLGNGAYTAFTGNSFAVTATGTYTVRLTDNAGNQNEYTVLVSQVDTTAPAVTVGTPATGWTSVAQNITVTYSDSQSGINTAQYKIVSDTVTKPTTGLSTLPASGGTVSVTTNGEQYIYYKVTDNAGNVTEGYSAAIRVDDTTPTLALSGGKTAILASNQNGLIITVERSFGASGGKVQVYKDDTLALTMQSDAASFPVVSGKGRVKVIATSNAGKSATEEFDVFQIDFLSQNTNTNKPQVVVDGGTASQPGASAPTRKGYTLTGWNKGGVAYNFTTPVTGNITLDAVWALDTPTVSLAVDKAEITYDSSNTVATLTATPRHAAADVTYTYEWYRGNTKLEGTGSTMPLTDVAHSGSYTVKVIASAGGLSSTQVTSNAVSVTINKANTEITTKPTASGITYGQSLSESTLDGGVGSVAANSFLGRVASLFTTPTPVLGAFSWTSGSTNPAVSDSNATQYRVTFTPTDTANYNASTATITLAVGKKTLTPSVNTVSDKVYDGNTNASGTIALAGAVLGESPTASGTFAFTTAAAGTNKPVNVTGIALADTWGNNYALSVDSLANITTTATITPKTVGLTWHGYTGLVYDTNAVNVTATATGLVTPDNCTVTVTGGAQTNAGTYTATATNLSDSNYALPSMATQSYTIAKAPVTFAVTNDTHIYDASAKAATVAQTASETPDVSGNFTVHYEQSGSTVASPTNKGPYDILVTITNANFKHSGQSDSVSAFKVGTLTIDGTPYPDADTMTWPTAADITYGQTLSDSTLTGGDQTAKGSYAWKEHTTVPTVTNSGHTVVFTPTDTNYATVEHTVSITVAKATSMLALPTAAGITYGDTLAKSTLSGGSAQAPYNGTDKTVPGKYTWTTPATMPAVADSNTTDYALTFTPDDTDNYSVVGTGKIKLAIAQKPIGITWAGHTALVYSGAPVSVTATATGLVTPDSCAITVNGGNETDAGTHTATATAVSNSNYVLPDTDLTQNYTIAKAPVSFVVSDNTHDYDTTAKAATVAQTASETPDVSGNFTVSYEKDGNAVPNPINMGIYSVFVELTNPNFRHKDKVDSASKIQVGLLTINGMEYPNVETMTWPTAESITYGQTLGDSTLTGGSEDSAGDYTWSFPATVPTVTNDGYSVVFTPTDTNYSPMEKVIDLAVTKATPTLALPTTTGITYGETLTDSTLTGGSASAPYNGVANIDVPGSYAWTVSTTMPSVADSDSTDYAITFTPTDTDNYNVVTTGQVKLVVAQREAALRWSGHADLVYTGNPVAVTVAVTNLVGADSCTVTVTGGTQTNAGDYTAEATVLDNGNYKLPANVEQAYTIAKAPVTFAVTANVHEYNATAKTAMVAQTAGETPGVAGKFTVSYAKDGNPVATPTNAGVYDVLATLTDANFKHKDKADTVREIKVGTLTIIGVKYPQADTMTWPTAADTTYGETLGDSTLTGGDQAAKGSYTWENGTAVPTVTNSGYTVVFTPTDGNYAPVEHTVSITVTKATPALTVPTAEGITYGDTLAKNTLSGGSAQSPYNGTDKTVPGKYTWTTPATMPAVSDSGTTDYSITFTPTDTANYNVVGTGKIKLAVAQRPVGLTWAGHTALVYRGAPVSVTATATNLVDGDTCTVTVTDGTKTDAGDYTARATALSNPNYKLPATPTQAYTIAKKPIKVLWSDLFPTYSGTQKYPTVSLEGVVNGEDCTVLSTGSASAGNAGRYKVVAALQGTRSSNYTMQNPNEILVIQAAPVTVSLRDYSYKYDGAAKYASVTATPDVLLTVTYKLAGNEVAAPTEEGIYDIIVALDGKNYRFADGTDGKARRMGALTIYKEKPPELYTITFDKGAEDAVGTAPTLPPSVRDTTHVLPSNTFLRAGHAFVGWKYGETLYQTGARFTQPANNNTVFTAQWEAATYDIGGVVDQDGKPVANVHVVLMRGAEQVAETATNQIGEYHFNNVLPGLYNLVASKPSPDGVGDIIMTIMVEVKASDIEQANITLPSGKTNSIVEVAPGTPKIIVGNLDQTFRNTEGNDFTTEDKEVVNKGGTVEIKFKAEEKQESEIAGDVAEIAKEAGRAKVGLYLSLDVEKTVTQPTDPATPDEEPSSDTTSVPETSVLLESVIPLPSDLQGKQSYIVYRVHEGTVESLTTGTDSGERIEVSEDKTTLTLYAQKFSTYAIAYTEKSSGGDDSDGDGGGSDWKPKPDPINPEQPAPVAPVVPAPGTDVPGNVPNPAQPGTTTPNIPEVDDSDKAQSGEDTEQEPDGGDKEVQKDEIHDALEEAIASLPDSLTDEERQEYIDRLTAIADAAIAALDENADPAEGDRIVKQAIADMHSIVKQAQATANSRQGTPFVLGSALLALAAVLLAVFALLKRKDKRRKLFSIIFAALSIAAFLLTTGWNGFALANPWTLVVAAFVICTLLGVFGWYSKEEDEDTATN